MAKSGKRIVTARKSVPEAVQSALQAFEQILPHAKKEESIDIVFSLGIDPKKSDQVIRGVVEEMPAGLGRKINVAVFTQDVAAAKQAGAEYAGLEDLFVKVKAEEVDCDVYIATSDVMPMLAKMGLGRILKGKMPNPKLGTVVENNKLAEAIKGQIAGKFTFRSNGNLVHGSIGRASFSAEDLVKNYEAVLKAIVKARPTVVKEHSYLKRAFCSSTMGPSVQIDISQAIKGAKG